MQWNSFFSLVNNQLRTIIKKDLNTPLSAFYPIEKLEETSENLDLEPVVNKKDKNSLYNIIEHTIKKKKNTSKWSRGVKKIEFSQEREKLMEILNFLFQKETV